MQKIYTPEQVGEMLQLHPLTVIKYIRSKKLRASKIGRVYRIQQEAIDEFLESTS